MDERNLHLGGRLDRPRIRDDEVRADAVDLGLVVDRPVEVPRRVGVVARDLAVLRIERLAFRQQQAAAFRGAVVEREHRPHFLEVGHDVRAVLRQRFAVRHERIGDAVVPDLPDVGHAVAVGVGKRILAHRHAGVGLVPVRHVRGEVAVRIDAVGLLVLVDVAVLDVDDARGDALLGVHPVGRRGRHLVGIRIVDGPHALADHVGVAPRLPAVADAVLVLVDVGAEEDPARADAAEDDVRRAHVRAVRDVPDVRYAQLRERLAAEVGVLVRLDDHVAAGNRPVRHRERTEVAHRQRHQTVTGRLLRIAVPVRDIHLEVGPRAVAVLVDGVVLGVHERHAPLVVRPVGENRPVRRHARNDLAVHEDRRRHLVDGLADGRAGAARQQAEVGIVDCHAVTRADLQTVARGLVVGRGEGERRRGRVDRRHFNRRNGRRDRPCGRERLHERRERLLLHRAVRELRHLVHAVGDGLDLLDAELLGVARQPAPVEVRLVDDDDVGLGEVRMVVEDHALRQELPLGEVLALVLADAVDQPARDADRLREGRRHRLLRRAVVRRRIILLFGLHHHNRHDWRLVPEFNHDLRHLMPADQHVAHRAEGFTVIKCPIAV